MRLASMIACSLVMALTLSHLAHAQLVHGQLTDEQLREKLTAATVVVSADFADREPLVGTGWVLSASKKQIVTSHHVVRNATSIKVILPAKNGNGWITEKARISELPRLTAKIFAESADADVAVLQVPDMPSTMPQLQLATGYPDPGAALFAVGHPGTDDYAYRFIKGTYEGKGFDVSTVHETNSTLRTRADSVAFRSENSGKGASGGALVDVTGRVIGIIARHAEDYPEHCRATAISEFQRMFGLISTNKRGTPRSLVGRWVCRPDDNKTDVEFAMEFTADRQFQLVIPTKIIKGTYRVGQTKVYLNSNRRTEAGLFEWLDDDHVTLVIDSKVVHCRRYDGGW